MHNNTASIDSSFYETTKQFSGAIIWAAFALIVVIRIIFYLIRRKPEKIKRNVLKPIFKAMSVQSEFYGYKPSDSDNLLETNNTAPIYNTTQIDNIVQVINKVEESEKYYREHHNSDATTLQNETLTTHTKN